jgi:predicted enzyme related to lactoylglutathione lyase
MSASDNQLHYLEIVTPNIESTQEHHETVLGWQFEGPIPELGNAMIASMPGGGTCGIRAPMHDMEKTTVRTYYLVSNLEQSVEVAMAAGGVLALPPTEIPGRGRIAIYMLGDIEQGLWQI